MIVNEWDVNNAATLSHVSSQADVSLVRDVINNTIDQLDLIGGHNNGHKMEIYVFM